MLVHAHDLLVGRVNFRTQRQPPGGQGWFSVFQLHPQSQWAFVQEAQDGYFSSIPVPLDVFPSVDTGFQLLTWRLKFFARCHCSRTDF